MYDVWDRSVSISGIVSYIQALTLRRLNNHIIRMPEENSLSTLDHRPCWMIPIFNLENAM